MFIKLFYQSFICTFFYIYYLFLFYVFSDSLFNGFSKHYSNTHFQENTTVALSCGTIVAAKRKWDDKWHRGRVVDVVDINKPAKVSLYCYT